MERKMKKAGHFVVQTARIMRPFPMLGCCSAHSFIHSSHQSIRAQVCMCICISKHTKTIRYGGNGGTTPARFIAISAKKKWWNVEQSNVYVYMVYVSHKIRLKCTCTMHMNWISCMVYCLRMSNLHGQEIRRHSRARLCLKNFHW